MPVPALRQGGHPAASLPSRNCRRSGGVLPSPLWRADGRTVGDKQA